MISRFKSRNCRHDDHKAPRLRCPGREDRHLQLAQGDEEVLQRSYGRPLQHEDPRKTNPDDLEVSLRHHNEERRAAEFGHRL
jgi:hypothetical protein